MAKHNKEYGDHGQARSGDKPASETYKSWDCMKQRCTNPKATSYEEYGGAGVKICKPWLESFENFLKDMGERPKGEYSLDRKNINKGYEPGNCKWSTKTQQNKNREFKNPAEETIKAKPKNKSKAAVLAAIKSLIKK